ncbi:MAG: cation-transporting P-type ATPase [Clostridia bacterium]|nr:cation-transporting P-type ATPase [Clostridia bacterium]
MNLLEVDLEKLKAVLGTDTENGLSSEQVLRNRREFGENILFEKKNSSVDLLKKIFGDIMMVLFLLVCLIDYLATERGTSLAALLITVALYTAFALGTQLYVKRAQERIRRFSGGRYHVRRNGRVLSVEKREIVPGDILLLEKGDVMPCDGIILRHNSLKILEASVTGRRVPLFKRSHDEVREKGSGYPYFECILFAGSVILHGGAKVFVCNTGRNVFDNENFTVSRQNTSMPLIYQTAMELKKQISLVWVVSCFFLFAWSVFWGQEIFSALHYVAAVVVASFPDSMELLCDLSIAYMSERLFAQGVVFRNPGAVDRLCDVNCVFVNSGDYLFYSQPIAGSFYVGMEMLSFKDDAEKARPLLENLLLAQNSRQYFAGKREEWTAERAILSAAAQAGLQKRVLERNHMYVNRYDFDPKYGYSCALTLCDGRYRLVIRGNPNSVLASCTEYYENGKKRAMNESTRSVMRANAKHLSEICERIVSVAVLNLSSPSTGDQRQLCRGMTYLGVFGLSTPVSAAAANGVSICQKSGIQTYLLTDDYPETVAALSRTVSIIGPDDYQYALSYQSYERMDRGIFVADIEKYKAYCGFPAEEKQSIVKFHKDNGDITLSLTGGLYDTLPQMESDISVVGIGEKQNAVRLNADILVKEKKYELIPLCINWSRILYRNVVHLMQYTLLIQFALGFSVLFSFAADGHVPFDTLPLLICCLGAVIPSGINIPYRDPGPRLEHARSVLREDKVVSLRALMVHPLLAGAVAAICAMLSRQIALYASGGIATANSAALITFTLEAYLLSLSLKFDSPLIRNLKGIGKVGAVTGLMSLLTTVAVSLPFLARMWQQENPGSGLSMWIVFFAVLLSLLPMAVSEWIKSIKKDDLAQSIDHKLQS